MPARRRTVGRPAGRGAVQQPPHRLAVHPGGLADRRERLAAGGQLPDRGVLLEGDVMGAGPTVQQLGDVGRVGAEDRNDVIRGRPRAASHRTHRTLSLLRWATPRTRRP